MKRGNPAGDPHELRTLDGRGAVASGPACGDGTAARVFRASVPPGAWLGWTIVRALAVLCALTAAALAATESPRSEEPPFVVRVVADGDAESERAQALARLAPAIVQRVARRLDLPPPSRLTAIVARGLPHDPEGRRRLGIEPAIPWAAGLAIPSQDRVILFADRVSTYPHDGLAGVFAHEVAHIVLAKALPPGARTPRWYDEGLAMVVERELSIEDAVRLAELAATARALPLERIDRHWPESAPEARAAYAQALSIVSLAERTTLPGAPRRLVTAMSEGLPFERAFERAYGRTLLGLELDWRDEVRVNYVILPIVALGALAQMTLGVLAVAAALKTRRTRARQRRELESRESAEDAALDEPTEQDRP